MDKKSEIYSAFGNKIRVGLIFCLAKKPKNVTELISNCNLSQSAVSQHLAKLKKAGLIEAKKEGRLIIYSLKYKKAADISSLLMSLEREISL
jgi:DNA-binding transcriptional ArsR family regulator